MTGCQISAVIAKTRTVTTSLTKTNLNSNRLAKVQKPQSNLKISLSRNSRKVLKTPRWPSGKAPQPSTHQCVWRISTQMAGMKAHQSTQNQPRRSRQCLLVYHLAHQTRCLLNNRIQELRFLNLLAVRQSKSSQYFPQKANNQHLFLHDRKKQVPK